MNKLLISVLSSVAVVFFITPTVFADFIPPDSHTIERCVKIVNLNEFSDIVVIGYYVGPMVDGSKTYQIENNTCLVKGYKFNALSVYWDAEYKSNSIDNNKLLWEKIEPYGGDVSNNNPLVKEDIEYSVAEFSEGKLILYKSRQVSKYNDGTPAKVQVFENPIDVELVTDPVDSVEPEDTVKKGFWSTISCFFKSLFGGSCQQ